MPSTPVTAEIKKAKAIPRRFVTLCGRVFRDTDPQYYPRAEYRGRTILFCTEACLGAFLADPDIFYKVHRNSEKGKEHVAGCQRDGMRYGKHGVEQPAVRLHSLYRFGAKMITPRKAIGYERYEFKKWEHHDAGTIVETPVSLTVNGQVWLTFMCTPVHLEAMAVGFLYNEGIIERMDEIADVRLCEHGDNVDVWLTRGAEQPTNWRRTSGCTGGVTAVDLLAKPDVSLNGHQDRYSPETIEHLMDLLLEAQVLYRETGGVHTSLLSDGEKTIVSAEDIGRHNTLDKIAGLCLMQNILPKRRFLVTTGRISSEMLQKAARMEVPILISRTSPSSLSIEMAERYGITLIGYARKHRFNVYSNPQRVGLS